MAKAMTLIENSYWTLQVDPTRPIPLTPEEPEDFMYEVCGKILCSTIEADKDRIAGRFRVYYADFESTENHGVSAFEVLDTHSHTCEYADAILDSNETPFSEPIAKAAGG